MPLIPVLFQISLQTRNQIRKKARVCYRSIIRSIHEKKEVEKLTSLSLYIYIFWSYHLFLDDTADGMICHAVIIRCSPLDFNYNVHSVPNKGTGSCPDPELPGTSLQKEGGEGPGLPHPGENSQLEPGRDGENMRGNREEPIPDVMKEDRRPTE